jgi:fructooligosaccharide transport system substrate-binding protein
MTMNITRRHVVKGSAAAAALVAAPGIVRAQAATLKVVWMGWPENQVTPLFDEVQKRHPNIKLQVERIPFTQVFQTIEVKLSGRTADPDIYICDSPLTASYASRGHLMALDGIVDKSRFTQSALAAATYDGKLYSAPFGSSMQVLFYNKAMLKAAGVEEPSADPAKRWTWEQLVEAAKKISKPADNVWGFAFEQSERPYQLLPLGQSLGGKALSDDGFKAVGNLNGPAFVEAYTFMQKLYGEFKVSPPGQFDPATTPELFGNGKVAFFLAGTFNADTFKSRFPGIDFGIAPHPYFAKGKPVTPTGAWHFGVNPRTAQKGAVETVVKELLSDDLQAQWFKLRPYPPVVKAIWQREAATFNTDMWKIVQHELDATAVPRPATPGFREYEDVLRVALRDIQTGANVQQALTAAATRIDREIAKYKG